MFGEIVAVSKRTALFRWFIVMLADALAMVCDGQYEVVRAHFIRLGMTDEQIAHIRRKTWRKHCMTHQPEPRLLTRRVWDVLMCARLMHDPESDGRLFFVDNWLYIAKKELAYVQAGLLSDKPGVALYEEVGWYCTGLRILRCLRNSADIEAYFQHRSRSVPVHARGASAEYHMIRSDGFDWNWNIQGLVRAKKIPDAGTSWLWVVDLVSQCLGDYTPANFFRAWPTTDTSIPPILNRGIYPEALGAAHKSGDGRAFSQLTDPEEQRRVLQFPELVQAGDVVGIERVTGITVRRSRLMELVQFISGHATISGVLKDSGAEELRSRTHVTDGGAGKQPKKLGKLSLSATAASKPVALPVCIGTKNEAGANADVQRTSAMQENESKYKWYRRIIMIR